MLESAPVEAGPEIVKIWQGMKRITIQLLLKYWLKVDKTTTLIDVVESCFDEWNDENVRYYGMRHTISGKPHGILRQIWPG